METGIELIAKERLEQIVKHGHTPEDDAINNTEGQFNVAVFALISDGGEEGMTDQDFMHFLPKGWDKAKWLYLCRKSRKERLAIAGALLAAELDRMMTTQLNKG